jgi:hypothetical protein
MRETARVYRGPVRLGRVMSTLMLVAALAAGFTAATGAAAKTPRCFGAASLDRLHPCNNPRLRRIVTPTPDQALFTLDHTPCTLIDAPFTACWFGTPPDKANRTVVLVGDSHADHWRAALYPVALKLGWNVIAVTHGSCPFSTAVQKAPSWKRDTCVAWNDQVRKWFNNQPQISAIFTSDHPGPVERGPGESMMDAWVKGITGAWSSLPATVQHILVIRDVPFIHSNTLPCVQRAIKRHRSDAGRLCALRRRAVVHHDPDIVAAQQTPGRAQVIDLTDYFCGSRLCYPVVGGALVYKDFYDHLTPLFASTLGPFILRDVQAASASWAN